MRMQKSEQSERISEGYFTSKVLTRDQRMFEFEMNEKNSFIISNETLKLLSTIHFPGFRYTINEEFESESFSTSLKLAFIVFRKISSLSHISHITQVICWYS